MSAKVKPNAPNRLIVEGRDDQWSIIALTTRHGWDWEKPAAHFPFLDNAEGVENALDSLPIAVRTYQRIGIVVDADVAPTNRWAQIRDRFAAANVTLPDTPDPQGTVVQAGDKRVGVWLMPDNQSPGKLEDFLAILVPHEDRCWGWAEDATRGAKDRGATFSDADFIKARVHTWLAWKREPGQPFGTAITAATFFHDAALANAFVQWLTRLYT